MNRKMCCSSVDHESVIHHLKESNMHEKQIFRGHRFIHVLKMYTGGNG
jgi:hypothetical protein